MRILLGAYLDKLHIILHQSQHLGHELNIHQSLVDIAQASNSGKVRFFGLVTNKIRAHFEHRD